MTLDLDERRTPKTLPHVFDLEPLAKHFEENPLPPGACKLIDLPGNDFLHTEDYNNVVAAALWTLAVKYDNLPNEERPSDREASRKVGSPPFKDERERKRGSLLPKRRSNRCITKCAHM
ncbi:hypothetical protein I307_04430 [Cryptococcus deuterogattii 99/473]|uniref:Uncharacterized protein n=1 Tax=Cryptococcus deuterogattii Ram5 TaxID=1296110 RepID=A0A0D0TZF8_9TREE|nr:hypothetical protein I309_04768 [Cryptococcus deuterogattii LA55]KIR34265.1 hypothetical protein I352_03502 [Cryptococcus deuterogattii MMRL2647]KIR41348.1 hypothetical protein I313_02475 [Cryptococcus deuterogattii Ram5]KIR69907.1 hypothetical protein I310_06220 [Cryptococcus deuterogattii CA1014]KIR89910.1 hypothetical protein I304_06155 [Cryptococcus deuterogattii CBS 10090]KIR98637.1 hypothetical protein L804_04213 [Cryptococcus deuterogattii 2001/935-1]KIY56318.1 hypothetical protein 